MTAVPPHPDHAGRPASDGEPIGTADDVVAALQRDPENTMTVTGSREVGGFEATELEFSGSGGGPDGPTLALTTSEIPDVVWIAPPDASMWVVETPDGLAVVTAEWFEPIGRDPARALATEILDSIVFG